VRDQIRDKLPYPFEDKGAQSVKNIARSVRVFALRPEAVAELPATNLTGPRRPRIANAILMIAGGMAFVIAAVWWVWPTTRSLQSPPAAVGQAGESTRPAPSLMQPPVAPIISPQQIALWDAVIAGNVTQAIVSIRAGADVNGLDTRANVAGPNGRRPLNWAAIRNDIAMISALLDAGASINSANLTGFTPLHHAAEAGSKEAATLLIARGANPTLRNRYEQTPEQTATASHHPEVAEILREAMTHSK
jgi:hypothetical protein